MGRSLDVRRSFVWLSQAWYADAARPQDVADEICVTSTRPGASCEFMLTWRTRRPELRPTPPTFPWELHVFGSQLGPLLDHFADVLYALRHLPHAKPAEIARALAELGVIDSTERRRTRR